MQFYFEEHWRMDWGLGNPNKTAVLIGCLMAASWMLVRLRRGGFVLALAGFAALGACLIQTYSRGGVLAALAGQMVLVARAKRPWPRSRVLAILATVLALITYASWDETGAARRFSQSATSDRSIANRLDIWRSAPRMMVEAPSGWGLGRSGWAYTQWYQDTATRYEYRSLVNSHLTWLVEAGWPGRIAYLMAMGVVLALCWPMRGRSALPLAIWTVFFCGAVFSSTMESVPLWVLPALALFHNLWNRYRARAWPAIATWATISIATLTATAVIAALGKISPSKPAIRGSPSIVHVGDSGPLWLLPDPDIRVLGTHYGMDIRKSAALQQWIVCKGLPTRELRGASAAIILSGRPSDSTLAALNLFPTNRLIWLNPADKALFERNIRGHIGNVHAIYGQRRSDSGFRGSVEAAKTLGLEPLVVRGAAMYLRQWTSFLNAERETQ